MSRKVPSLSYEKIIRALQRGGWIIVRQRGRATSGCRNEPGARRSRSAVSAHKPVKRSTLSHILKQARMDTGHFSDLL